jgi:hypothetical protein
MLSTNSARFSLGFYDLKMHLGVISDVSGELERTDEVTVVMSPAHAKVFSVLVGRQVSKYEDLFGEIEIPPEIMTE